MAVGNAEAVGALATIKSNIDSGAFKAIQLAAAVALAGAPSVIKKNNKVFETRRNVLIDGLNSLGWKLKRPKATFYMWVPVPTGETSTSFTEKLLEECAGLEEEVTGEDGRPKFNTEDMLKHMEETGIKSPMKAYKDKYEKELDEWKESELNKTRGSSLPTLSSMGTNKQPIAPKVTKDNLNEMVREALLGGSSE